eukprot:TRINITY_DN18961_c0_g1_i1.p1 TRINITY_DN18961_c0_g1~~TRINITY_DN18961_c0_g1_i1.p1  ORF type:complete len:195 (-),score=12.65 TRINITY_DN18961_c0_g1_i1:98-682(-)
MQQIGICSDIKKVSKQLQFLGLDKSVLSKEGEYKLRILAEICETFQTTPGELQQFWVQRQLEDIPLVAQLLELKQQLIRIKHKNNAGKKFLEDLQQKRQQAKEEIIKQSESLSQKQQDMNLAQAEIQSLTNEIQQLQESVSTISVNQQLLLQKKQQFDDICKQIQLLQKELQRYEGLPPNLKQAKAVVEQMKSK